MFTTLFLLTSLSASQPSVHDIVPAVTIRVTQEIATRSPKRGRSWRTTTGFGKGVLVMGRCLVRSPTGGYDAYSVLGSGNRLGWDGTMQRIYTGGYSRTAPGGRFLPPRGPACTPDFGNYRGKMVF